MAEIYKLNLQYRNKAKSTNILTFPNYNLKEEQKILEQLPEIDLGNIIASYQNIEKEAKEQNKLFTDHLTHLIIHSLLHLVNFDHQNINEQQVMEDIEIKTLNKINIKNPYI